MKTISYVLTILGAIFGGFQLFSVMIFAESAPQQAAGAAMAVAWAVLPYCFARSVEKIGDRTTSETLEKHWEHQESMRIQSAPKQRTDIQPSFDPYTGRPLAR